MDLIGVPWEYEAEAFELPSGNYLPDFWLPNLDTFYEVKGTQPTRVETDLALELADATGNRVMIAWGMLPETPDAYGHDWNRRGGDSGEGGMHAYFPGGGGDHDYAWCKCPWCGKPGIEYEARSARICGWETHHSTTEAAWETLGPDTPHWRIDDKCYTGDAPDITRAYQTVRARRWWK